MKNENDDLPAIIDNIGSMIWYKNGKQHRDNDMPAAIFITGSMYWYKNNVKIRNYFSDYINILDGKEHVEYY